MKVTTYAGKEIECNVHGFRPLTSEEILKYDDGSEVVVGSIAGTGNLICSRIGEYYIAAVEIDGEYTTALLHADSIISSARPGNIRCGYRNGSLNIYQRIGVTENYWYNRRSDEDECRTQVLGVSMASDLSDVQINHCCDHVSGIADIDDKLNMAIADLVTATKRIEMKHVGVFSEIFKNEDNTIQAETDKEYADRLCDLADNYKLLTACKVQIIIETFKKIN